MMKKKARNGVRFRDFLAEELKDAEIRRHYERAKASAAQAVIDARRRSGLTQAELGRRIGSDQKGVWRLESGLNNATVETLVKVAKATGGILDIKIKSPKPNKVPASRSK